MLLLGPPGSGKGTLGRALGALPRFHHCSTGEIFRALDPDSEVGRTAAKYFKRGELVPDELTVQIWRKHMQDLEASGAFDPAQDLLLLDGIPRNPNQWKMLEEDVEMLCVLHLCCGDEEVLVQRLLGRARKEARADDTQEVIRHRLAIYHEQTAPLLACAPSERLVEVDALPPPAQVLQAVREAIQPFIGNG